MLAVSLPTGGPLRLLAISSTVALLAFVAAIVVLLVRRERRDAAWASLPLLVACLSFALGRLAPALHPFATALTFAVAARNAIAFRGAVRLLQVVGGVAWVVGSLAARALFS